jgi:aspartate aminotransferase
MNQLKLSKHTLFLQPEGAYAVLSKAQVLEQQGKKIIHLEIGQPDFPTPSNITNAGITALKNGKTKYTPPLGIYPLREAIAQFVFHSRKYRISAENIAVTPSGKTALFTALSAIINPGDEVIYPDPGFPTYKTIIDFFGGHGIPLPLYEKNNFSIDMNVFSKKLSKKTRLIILNSPSNPTGGMIPFRDLKTIATQILKTNAWVVSDEIYHSLCYSNENYQTIASLPHMKNRTIIVDGFSKTWSMTGWRLGYLVGPLSIMEKIDCILTHTVGCTASFTQEAGFVAITSGDSKDLQSMKKAFLERRNYIVEALNSLPGITCMLPDGAFYVFPNITYYGKSSQQIANLILSEGGVALLPGTAFGKYGEGYLRISYAANIDVLKEGIERIRKVLNTSIH